MVSLKERLSFKDALHQNGGRFEHPFLTKREQQVQAIFQKSFEQLKKMPRTKEVSQRYPELVPHYTDQDLRLTPYDDFEGFKPDIPPEDLIEGWKRTREFNLMIANHPLRIESMRRLEHLGFKPPKKLDGVIDAILKRGVLPQLSDLGHNVDVIDEYEEACQVHRTHLFENGPFSFVGRRVRSFIGLGAMPDINGSVLMLETAAKMHMLAEVPEVGVFSDPKKQAELAKAVFEKLTKRDPILEGRTDEELDFIIDHWKSNIVGVLEVNREKALKRAEELTMVGITSFRIYGHSVGNDVVDTVRALRREYDNDIEIFASQITNVNTAIECEGFGADAVIIGVGSGGRCTTAERSQLIPSNAALAWRLRGEINIPVIGEGGAVDEVVISILVGMSGVNGSGSIGGGTFEAPGGMFFLTRGGKTFEKPYGGEASPRTKWLSKRTYPTGMAFFSEGEQSFKKLIPTEESMTQKVLGHWERIILGAVMLGVNNGPHTISAMQNLEKSPLWEKSPTTQYLQRTH